MSIANDPSFLDSELRKALESLPFGYVDVGARGGVQTHCEPVAELASVMLFEPDESCLEDLKASLGQRWRQTAIEPVGLGARSGPATLNLYAHGVNHSLLAVNPAFRDRYGVASLADAGTASIELATLDEVLFERHAGDSQWGEFLKLDAQGAEIDILKGAARTLTERTVAVLAEFSFIQIYRDQPCFSELERFLADRGFTFYGFHSIQGWSRKFLDKCSARGRERLCFGDAVFLRDPLPSSARPQALTLRQWQTLYLAALLLEFYDFAIEIATEAPFAIDEADRLIALARSQARHTPEEAVSEVEALLARMKASPAEAGLELCRFVDGHRSLFDVADAALPRSEPVPRGRRKAATTQ
jgi:FkbM family methyltransferase